ncbi:MAG: hypothetical protein DRP66_02805 [Planctomycetota bacterium]|nr:MAG: hypothetical protein DRP66_02805 [Planctomycetota bacterium]
MVTIEDAQVDLFGAKLPDMAAIEKLAGYVNGSEINRISFEEMIDGNLKNKLAAGIGLYILGRCGDAAERLKKAPDCKEKYMYLGYAHRGLKQFDKAIESFSKAGKHHADSLTVSLEKAATYIMDNRLDEAGKELKSCSNFEKVSADYHYYLGRHADARGEYAEAMANYKVAAELAPGHAKALFQLAYAYDLRGDEDAAIDYYRQVIRQTPAHVNALLNLAVIYEDRGEYEKASACVDGVLKVHPNHARALLFWKDIESCKVMIYDEEKERRRDRRAKILEIPISDFELSVRSRNCLKKMGILTLGDLLRITEAELLSYKNFGETSLVEIKKILDSKSLTLGMAIEETAAAAAAAGENAAAADADDDVLEKTMDDLELSVRSRRALSRLGVNTLVDLIQKTEAELLGCKNFGVTSLNEIKDRLSAFGLGLRTLD